MKVLVCIGTRPEAIKMSPVIQELRDNDAFDCVVCATGQHKKMLEESLNSFSIEADYFFDVMTSNQSIVSTSATIMSHLQDVIDETRPDYLLAQGDTTTSFIASFCAYYNKIPLAHVEAGMRTGNSEEPWPEETNRCMISLLAQRHYAATKSAELNLLNEGISKNNIVVTGNTVIDALDSMMRHIQAHASIRDSLEQAFDYLDYRKKLILVTTHRRESFGSNLKSICAALKTISMREDVQIIFPVHPNPNVKEPVMAMLKNQPNIYLVAPQSYMSFAYLLNRAYLVLSDSGGVQEEAPYLNTPVLVMRDTSERMEAVWAGAAKLVGTSSRKITDNVFDLLDNASVYQTMTGKNNIFGDGKAAKRIVNDLLDYVEIRNPAYANSSTAVGS